VRGIDFTFASVDELAMVVQQGAEEREVALACADGLRDGEWVLASFTAGEESVSIAARVSDRGDAVHLSFEVRDWRVLCQLAATEDTSCSGPCSVQLPAFAVQPPPNSRVLVVDDDPDVRAVISCMLSTKGFRVTVVDSAEEAYAMLQQSDVDLVVLDWNLPGMSGLELVRQIRSDHDPLPVLFLTANSSPVDVAEAFSSGADDYVTKPFRAPELGARIIGLLRRSQLPAAPVR
jgi:two-component system phosphate regulon response regulator PhoB